MERIPNALIKSSSPYLLQHAYNPVEWYPWGEEALKKARDENKLLIISVGYSACHWCHVMEHESFEDDEVAAVMNRSFVCIKVDREERPDIDQVYMDAVQLMTGRGGWPLNVIALPDQRPIYGGTYFPKDQWRNTLLQLAAFFKNDPVKCDEYAKELTEGVRKMSEVVVVKTSSEIELDHTTLMQNWSKQWDREEGGPLRAPKFPLPDSYRYLLAAATVTNDEDALKYVHLTLQKMAFGGIYDQIGGGFARYSTDMLWKVPHFEKMLYDNALLISLYADSYKASGNSLYKQIIEQSMEFVCRELSSPSGAFYSALDADSEGVEGKFYCWNPDEMEKVLGEDARIAIDYYNINARGYWEHDFYIPLRHDAEDEFASAQDLTVDELKVRINTIREKLFQYRQSKVAPGLDDKILCSWNALMLSACVDAYTAVGNKFYLNCALKSAAFIRTYFVRPGDKLWHAAKEVSGSVTTSIEGFLEDYAFVIDAFLSLYGITMDETFLEDAIRLTKTVLSDFSDDATGLFWFTSTVAEPLISRKLEVTDDVIPSSNAVMSQNLLRLSRITEELSFEERAQRMLKQMVNDTIRSTPWHSRWARVMLEWKSGAEIAVCGEDAQTFLIDLQREYLPLTVFSGAPSTSSVALLRNRFKAGETVIYVCRNHACQSPVNSVKNALLSLSA